MDEPSKKTQFNPMHHVSRHLNPADSHIRDRIISEEAIWEICLNDHAYLLLPHGAPGHHAKGRGVSSKGLV